MTDQKSPPRALTILETELDAASRAYGEALSLSRAASRDETAALNKLNAVQREMSERFEMLRASAVTLASGSDWAQDHRRRESDTS